MNEKSEKPIFLTGVYRSGTTLLSQILNQHPDISFTYDTLHYYRFYLNGYNPVEENYKKIVKESKKRLKNRFGIEVPAKKIISTLKDVDKIKHKHVYKELMIETFCNGDRSLRWGEKSSLQWTNIPTFLSMFPKGKAIHIFRDPRDVLASYKRFTIEPADRYLDSIFNCLHSMNWSKTRVDALPSNKYKRIRHEDIVTNTERTIENLCDFLEVDYKKEMLDISKSKDRENKDWKPNTAFDDIKNKKISDKSVGRWKNRLNDFEVVFAESIIGEKMLSEFDYEISDRKINWEEMEQIWEKIRDTPLIKERLNHFFNSGGGVEEYPSDPTDPDNWDD